MRFAEAEAHADEAVEADASEDDVAPGDVRLDAESVGDFGLEEGELLVGPAGVAPRPGAEGVAVADDADAGGDDDRALLLHRRARLRGREDRLDPTGNCLGGRERGCVPRARV